MLSDGRMTSRGDWSLVLLRPWREVRERWIVEWEGDGEAYHLIRYSEQAAREEAADALSDGGKLIAIKKVTYREGEGLEA